jgi:hypothetical protein
MKVVHGFLGDLSELLSLGSPLTERWDQNRSSMQQFVSVHHRVASKC